MLGLWVAVDVLLVMLLLMRTKAGRLFTRPKPGLEKDLMAATHTGTEKLSQEDIDALYVGSIVWTVRALGLGGLTAVTIAGTFTVAMLVDHFGVKTTKAVTLRVGNPQCVVLGEVTDARLHSLAAKLAAAAANASARYWASSA